LVHDDPNGEVRTMASRESEAERIFLEAVEHHAPHQWAEYVQQAAAADPALVERVEALLRGHGQANPMLDEGRFLEGSHLVLPSPTPGTVIGPYKLMEQIGEGGMGLVFVAEQQQPVRRQVALKVIKPGMDTRQVIARFEAERQALALMDHPNIAQVHDGGTTPTGRPYFVMELVEGVPITEYCDRSRAPIRERLELLLQVCQAVQHAHQKGIIHRDLKPSNVLVVSQDGTPLVKVIDFGVAKAVGQRLTEKTIYTQAAQVMGTPLYMSPEQAGQSGLDVDTRTDIYALGVLLYELLTGTTPFDKERLRAAGYDEMRRILREEEPPRPSARLSTLGRAATTVSTQRKSDPKRLRQLIRGELDWIVMKALEKDRNRRYETTSAFAADIQRYLHDEPVLACPPAVWYRCRKYVQRHKGPLLAAGVVLLVALVSLAVVFGVRQQAASEQAALQERAREQQERAREQLELQLYCQTVGLAERERDRGNAGRAEQLLDGEQCPPSLRRWEWYYLKRLRFGPSSPLRLDTLLMCLSVSPQGRWLAVAGRDGTIRICDVTDGREVRRLPSQGDSVTRVAFSPDGRRLASGCEDGKVRVWELETGRPVFPLPHEGEALCVAFSPDNSQLLTGGTKGAFVWDATTGARLASLTGHAGPVHAVAFSPDGRLAATAGERDRRVKVWDATTWQELRTLGPHVGTVFSVAFHPDSKRLAAASGFFPDDGDEAEVLLWDVDTGQQTVKPLRGHQGGVLDLAFSPNGRRLVTAGTEDATIRVWDVASGLETLILRGHQDAVFGVAFSIDGHRLFSAGADHTLRIWDGTPPGADGGSLRTFTGHTARVTSVAFDRDGVRLVSGSMDGAVRVWDLPTGTLFHKIPGSDGTVQSVTFSPAGDWLGVLYWPGIQGDSTSRPLRVWDSHTWRERPVPPRTLNYQGRSSAFCPDGRRLVVACSNLIVPIDGTTFLPSSVVYDHDSILAGVSVRRDGRHAAAAVVDGQICIWNLDDPRHVLAVLSPPSLDGLVNLHVALSPQPVHRWQAHTTRVAGIAYSPTADVLASCGLDGSIRLWDASTYKPLPGEPLGHTSGVRCLAFSPDGRRLATGGNDATVCVWDVAQRRKLFVLYGHTAEVYAVTFSRDGRYLASGSLDRTVRVWDAQPAGNHGLP
jgi:WD40 repeat protein/serine/threonine protein kinase